MNEDCAHMPNQLDSQARMADELNLEQLSQLRGIGVANATFHPNGKLATVEFFPKTDPADSREDSSEPPKRRVSATGGLVPRAVPE